VEEKVGDQTMNFYDSAMAKAGGASQNNHLHWAGVEIAAIAIANNDPEMFVWAVAAYRNGVAQITPDGTLPLEIAPWPAGSALSSLCYCTARLPRRVWER
jgi:poly(beta-D-mannuronate) lyase